MIKLIVFDFGGVYFTYDYFKLMNEFSKELRISIEKAKQAWNAKLDEFTKGECKENEFWKAFLDTLNKDYNTGKLHKIVIDQFKPVPEIQNLIDKLKRNYRIGMITEQTDWLDEINNQYNFYPQFEPLIISKNEGTTKSNEKIFRILIERSNCQPNEILFIDDTLSYGRIAKNLGINFIHYQSQNQLEKDLTKKGIAF